MSRYRRSNATGATFFFTVVMHRRQAMLCDKPLRVALHDAVIPAAR
jgi:putative transposase